MERFGRALRFFLGLESRYSTNITMETQNNSTNSRDVLINDNSVEVERQDGLSRLVAGDAGIASLHGKMDAIRKAIIGIGLFFMCVGVILGFLIGHLYYSQEKQSSYATILKTEMDLINLKAEKSEALLAVVCKAEFGQTSTVCDLTHQN